MWRRVSRRPNRFRCSGPHVERTKRFVAMLVEAWRLATPLACRIEVCGPSDHTGLGVGTQLGLAIAAGVRRFFRLPDLPVEALAAAVGRGKRSAVGSYGFQLGGLIVDGGTRDGDWQGRLAKRIAVPAAWRFVLIRRGGAQGLAGAGEMEAFANLPPVPVAVTRELRRITNDAMLPAVDRADCAVFGEAVYQFNRLAGECFASVQSGPFASERIARLVEAVRGHGVAGVGQSSWGPTVFAVVADEAEAKRLAEWLATTEFSDCEVTVARANNSGAAVTGFGE